MSRERKLTVLIEPKVGGRADYERQMREMADSTKRHFDNDSHSRFQASVDKMFLLERGFSNITRSAADVARALTVFGGGSLEQMATRLLQIEGVLAAGRSIGSIGVGGLRHLGGGALSGLVPGSAGAGFMGVALPALVTAAAAVAVGVASSASFTGVVANMMPSVRASAAAVVRAGDRLEDRRRMMFAPDAPAGWTPERMRTYAREETIYERTASLRSRWDAIRYTPWEMGVAGAAHLEGLRRGDRERTYSDAMAETGRMPSAASYAAYERVRAGFLASGDLSRAGILARTGLAGERAIHDDRERGLASLVFSTRAREIGLLGARGRALHAGDAADAAAIRALSPLTTIGLSDITGGFARHPFGLGADESRRRMRRDALRAAGVPEGAIDVMSPRLGGATIDVSDIVRTRGPGASIRSGGPDPGAIDMATRERTEAASRLLELRERGIALSRREHETVVSVLTAERERHREARDFFRDRERTLGAEARGDMASFGLMGAEDRARALGLGRRLAAGGAGGLDREEIEFARGVPGLGRLVHAYGRELAGRDSIFATIEALAPRGGEMSRAAERAAAVAAGAAAERGRVTVEARLETEISLRPREVADEIARSLAPAFDAMREAVVSSISREFEHRAAEAAAVAGGGR